jgi:pimeloyl-ACP methyl ester carboxylesterase
MTGTIPTVVLKSPGRDTSVTQLASSAVTYEAKDGVLLRGVFAQPTGNPDADTELAIVVGHGLTHHTDKPAVRRVLVALAKRAGVVAFDFRGHGRSAGGSTVGDAEVLDIAAGVAFARKAGYRRVATVGFSMGASVVLRHAALRGDGIDCVVAVSSPARWWVRETAPMRRVHWLLEQPHGRLVARALGVRLGSSWEIPPESPVEVMHRIAPIPLLSVHGERDRYFPVEHAQALHRAADGHGDLWVVPNFGHAESAMTPDLVDRIAAWVADAKK